MVELGKKKEGHELQSDGFQLAIAKGLLRLSRADVGGLYLICSAGAVPQLNKEAGIATRPPATHPAS